MTNTPIDPSLPPAQPRRWLRLCLKCLGGFILGLPLLIANIWALAALHFDVRIPWMRTPLMVLYVVALIALWIFVRRPWVRPGLTLGAFVLVLAWWLSLQPTNEADWQPDVAKLAYAEINGNQVTMHNIRNCDYRTETDFDVHYYDKTFDLDKIRSADLFMVYWGSPLMAHTMVSFGFEGGDYVCFSIETRKKKGQSYSAVQGLFRQFELIYIAADERDLVRLRTNYRKDEEAYLYRLRGTPEQARKFFLNYLRSLNNLHERASWYNALRHNCTTSIRMQRAASDRAPWDWRMIVNGYGNELLYERGMINTNLSVAELKERSHINAAARAADKAPDFSQLIRKGLPGIEP
jgi:hypothetical protein